MNYLQTKISRIQEARRVGGNSLPCSTEGVHRDYDLEAQRRQEACDETQVIIEKYGSIANWRAWEIEFYASSPERRAEMLAEEITK
jgi:hypothetical protein